MRRRLCGSKLRISVAPRKPRSRRLEWKRASDSTIRANRWAGAEASARLYSLIETAKANRCEPYAYLCHVFTELPKAKTLAEIEALLPWNFARAATLSIAA